MNARSLWMAGGALLAFVTAIAFLSPRFAYGGEPLERPTLLFVFLAVAAGGVYFGAVWLVTKGGAALSTAGLLAVGIVLRGVLLPSTPILEDDYYRYFFDGALVCHGVNPYGVTPTDAYIAPADSPEGAVAAEAGELMKRINHPRIATIYPPVAQGAFALAHVIRPYSLGAWRGVLLCFDGLTLLLLIALLRRLGLPTPFALVYWWNPLVAMETVNRAHMDVVALPFILGAVLLVLRVRPLGSGAVLAVASAAKLWPLALAPLFARRWGPLPRSLVASALAAVVFVVLMLPVSGAIPLGERSGFFAYSDTWEMNDALYMVIHRAVALPFSALEGASWTAVTNRVARGVVAAIVVGVALGMAARGAKSDRAFCGQIVVVLGVLFMLSPTQFPWYYTWMAPFLACAPRTSLVILTATLPLYFLKFWFEARDSVMYFHHGVVWLEFGPTILLATAEGWRSWASRGTSHA